MEALSQQTLRCLAGADDECTTAGASVEWELTFAHAANGEADPAGEEDEHEPIERQNRSRHPHEISGEEERSDHEHRGNSRGCGKRDEVAGSDVAPRPAMHS